MYEDLSEMAPGVQLAALTGKTDVTCKDGGANLRLRITTVSSAHSKRRFRFKVAPMDVTLAAERPRLIQFSEAFSVVSHTQTVEPMPGGPMGQPPQMAPQEINAATLAAAPPEQQKQLLGDRLFPLIQNVACVEPWLRSHSECPECKTPVR